MAAAAAAAAAVSAAALRRLLLLREQLLLLLLLLRRSWRLRLLLWLLPLLWLPQKLKQLRSRARLLLLLLLLLLLPGRGRREHRCDRVQIRGRCGPALQCCTQWLWRRRQVYPSHDGVSHERGAWRETAAPVRASGQQRRHFILRTINIHNTKPEGVSHIFNSAVAGADVGVGQAGGCGAQVDLVRG